MLCLSIALGNISVFQAAFVKMSRWQSVHTGLCIKGNIVSIVHFDLVSFFISESGLSCGDMLLYLLELSQKGKQL